MKKGALCTLITTSLQRTNHRREYVNATSCYTTVQYDLVEVESREPVRIAKVQRDGTVWYTPLALEAQGLCPQYRLQGGQRLDARAL